MGKKVVVQHLLRVTESHVDKLLIGRQRLFGSGRDLVAWQTRIQIVNLAIPGQFTGRIHTGTVNHFEQ